MSNNNGIDAKEPDFSTTTNYSHVDENIVDTTNINIDKGQTATSYGETCPFISNENVFYDEAGSLFNQPLILVKEFKSPADIRYKTDYFPRSGRNAGKSQAPRYLHTVDNKQENIIRFPNGYKVPQNIDNYFLEVALLTVPRVNQHHMHVNKFQLNHTNGDVLDENPFFIPLTQEHFEKGEIVVKLVPVKTRKSALKNIASLTLFRDQTAAGWTENCESVKDLEYNYELSHCSVAFSLGYLDANDQFIRFTNTTVISNEIIEKEKSKSSDNVTCPNCSHCFSIREQKQKNKKRSVSPSSSTKKKRSSQ